MTWNVNKSVLVDGSFTVNEEALLIWTKLLIRKKEISDLVVFISPFFNNIMKIYCLYVYDYKNNNDEFANSKVIDRIN